MKILNTVTLGPKGIAPEIETDIAVRKAIATVAGVLQSDLSSTAPGLNLPYEIKVGPVAAIGDNTYSFDITIPRRYLVVIKGSGLYGPSGLPYEIVPKAGHQALKTNMGEFFSRVMSPGQRKNPFFDEAMAKARQTLKDQLKAELKSVLT